MFSKCNICIGIFGLGMNCSQYEKHGRDESRTSSEATREEASAQ
jgi:hypothetical protein